MIRIERRNLVLLGAATVGALALGCGASAPARDARNEHDERDEHDKHDKPAGKGEEDVSPAEDLMREHGVLNRILLVYEESARRLEASGPPLPLEALTCAAAIVRNFIEGYHEKLEEEFLFPRFEKAGKLVDLVATLKRQHVAGRNVTADIQKLATDGAVRDPEAKKKLVGALRSFVRMYRPHEAREDTVLFPALPAVVGRKELEALGERFEEKEHELFGASGFEGVVVQVAKIEETLGIADLNQFTPG